MIKFSDGTQYTFYQWLGIQPLASEDEIKAAYRKMALKLHPDRHKEKDKDRAHQAFVMLQNALNVLTDPVKRERYDLAINFKRHPTVKKQAYGMTVNVFSGGTSDNSSGNVSVFFTFT